MADSASNSGVEDVLSSVRRLVSGEIPRKPRPKPAESDGALLLTSAQRISEEVRAKSGDKSLEERIAELEIAVSDRDDDFEPDGSEDQALHQPDRIVYTRPPTADEADGTVRRTSRLSEISLIETGPANDDVEIPEGGLHFRHEGSAGAYPKTSDEAPMAEDVPSEPAPKAEVKAFSNPDEMVEQIEERLDRGGAADEARTVSSPPPFADTGSETADDAEEKDVDEDLDFEAALTRAVAEAFEKISEKDLAEADDTDEEIGDEANEYEDVLEEEFDPVEVAEEAQPPEQGLSGVADAIEDGGEGIFNEMPETIASEFAETEFYLDPDATVEPADDDEAETLASTPAEQDAAVEEESTSDQDRELAEKIAAEGELEEHSTEEDEQSAATEALPETTDGEEIAAEPTDDPVKADDIADTDAVDEDTLENILDDNDPVEPIEDVFSKPLPPEIEIRTVAAAAALEVMPDDISMRHLVSRLIREELQGELGERITRNVRKLVRREIKRALEARDLS